MSDHEIASMFKTETIKLFTDIIYLQKDNCHFLMVKTWQKVIFNCKLPSNRKVSASASKSNAKRKPTNSKGSVDSMNDSKG